MSRTRKPPRKSPSERLRGLLYQFYDIKKPMGVTFDEYYDGTMEKLIKKYSNKLKQLKDE